MLFNYKYSKRQAKVILQGQSSPSSTQLAFFSILQAPGAHDLLNADSCHTCQKGEKILLDLC